IGHIAPEAVDGGPNALIREDDSITVDIAERSIALHVDEDELQARRATWQPVPHKFQEGGLGKYTKLDRSSSTGTSTEWPTAGADIEGGPYSPAVSPATRRRPHVPRPCSPERFVATGPEGGCGYRPRACARCGR